MTLLIPKGKDMDAPLPSNFATTFPMVKVERGTVDKHLIPWDKTSIGPRIGIAYSLQSKTAIRAGFGIFYGGEENEGASPNGGNAAPFNLNIQLEQPAGLSSFEINPLLPRISQGYPLDVLQRPARMRLYGVTKNFKPALVQKWNVAVQQELPGNMAWEISYIGNHQAHEVAGWDPNTAYARPEIPAGSVSSDSLRPVPIFDSVQYYHSNNWGNYAGLATKLEKRMSHGMDFLIAYTWGHAMANSGTPLYGGLGGTRGDPRDNSQRYSTASWDLRHNFTASFVYDLPFGQGRKFGGDIGSIHPDIVAGKDPNAPPPGGRTTNQYFDTTAVTTPVAYTPGTLPNATNVGPGQRCLDLSMFKAFRIAERYRVQLRFEGMNISNTPMFMNPGGTHGDATFGQINSASGERNIQIAVRFMF